MSLIHAFPIRRSSDLASRAAAALITLKDAMGSAYPPPTAAQLLHRGDRLMDASEYAFARKEYEAAAASTARVEHDQRSEEHTSELQSRQYLVCSLLLE